LLWTLTNEIPFPNYINCAPNEDNGCVKPEIPEEVITLCKAGEFPERRSEFFRNHNFILFWCEDDFTLFWSDLFACFMTAVLIHKNCDYHIIVRSVGLTCVDIKRVEVLQHEEERKKRLTTIRPVLDDVYGTDISSVIADYYDS